MGAFAFKLERLDGNTRRPALVQNHPCSSGTPATRFRWARTGRFRWFAFAMRTRTNRRYWSLRTRPKERLAPRADVS
jgi:hypothetical protein